MFYLLLVNGLTSLPFMWEISLMDVTLKPFRVNEVLCKTETNVPNFFV